MLYKKEMVENIESLREENKKLNREIERLINIINKFEEWLISEIKLRKIVNKDFELRKALTILQEIKGSDKK